VRRPPSTPHCEVNPVHWSQYLDGEFSSAKCRECEAHLAACAECRRKVGDLRRTLKVLAGAGRQPFPRAVKAGIRKRARATVRGTR
jgi:anti-sigma factor RsiW